MDQQFHPTVYNGCKRPLLAIPWCVISYKMFCYGDEIFLENDCQIIAFITADITRYVFSNSFRYRTWLLLHSFPSTYIDNVTFWYEVFRPIGIIIHNGGIYTLCYIIIVLHFNIKVWYFRIPCNLTLTRLPLTKSMCVSKDSTFPVYVWTVFFQSLLNVREQRQYFSSVRFGQYFSSSTFGVLHGFYFV